MTDTPDTLRSISLHIGVHKTASTHLQHSLLNARFALLKAGVAYHGPHSLRAPGRTLRALLGKQARGEANVQENLRLLAEEAPHLVLSEENLAGTLHNGRGKVRMPVYPDAARDIAAIVTSVAPVPVDLFVAVRHPAHYLSSAYGQILMGDVALTQAQFRRRNPVRGIDWLEFVTSLRATPGLRNLYVWRYEDYMPLFDTITGLMLGKAAAAKVAPLDAVVHQGLSAAAVARVTKEHADGLRDGAGIEARKAMPISDEAQPYSAFTRSEIKEIGKDYLDQMMEISRLPQVTLLLPAET